MTPEQLRNSILQYAIEGKLVEQRQEEGTAEKLYKQLLEEKKKLTNENKILKKKETKPFYSEEELEVFNIPDKWKWVQLSDISIIQEGAGIRKWQYKDKGIQILCVTNILEGSIDVNKKTLFIAEDEYREKYLHLTLNKGDIVTSCSGGSWGKIALYDCDNTMMLNTSTLRMRFFGDVGNNMYLYYICKSAFFKKQLLSQLSGMQPNFGYAHYSRIMIPLPPLEEQKRIVAKIEELEPFIKKYEKAWNELEALNKKFPGDMKNSILQYAIEGKLVEQRPEEGTAEELFRQIQEEKQNLIKEGKIKKEKALPEIMEDEIPFDIPDSWKWVRLDEVVSKNIKRGKSPKYAVSSNTLVFAQKCNTKAGYIDLDLAKYLDEDKLEKYPVTEYMVDKDIVINSTGNGTLGRIGLYRNSDNPKNLVVVPDSHVTIVRASESMEEKYIYYLLKAYQPQLEKLGSGSTNQTELKPELLRLQPVPLPPLEEQKRIIAKIEELLPLCDALNL